MKKENISKNVIRRLPRYLRKLDDLAYNGADHISSGELGAQMGLTPSQIRQDFSCFGEFGQQGYGYNIKALRGEISSILGMNRTFQTVIVGIGNLGHALIENFGFARYGFKLVAAFDISPEIVGTSVSGVPILDSVLMPVFLAQNHVDIAVLSTPRRSANSMAELLYDNGVRAIWNFTNIELTLKRPDVLIEDIHFSDSLLALSYYLSCALDADNSQEDTP